MIPKSRRHRAALAAARHQAQALLVTHPADIRYLCGFSGSAGALLLVGSRATLFTDGRYTTQAKAEIDGAELVIVDESPAAAACHLAMRKGVLSCAIDAAHTTVAALGALRMLPPPKLRKSWFVETSGLVATLREIKDEVEQEQLRAAATLGCTLFDQVLEYIVPGATEMEVSMALEYMARLAGAESMSFETIVAGGERSALPHGRATNAKLPRRGFVTLDFGIVLDGYCSDMTRTVHLGRARDEERETYHAVQQAQEAAVIAVRAGALTSDVDDAARRVLTEAGLGESFTHSTGHGVGLEIHEGPRLAKWREGVAPARLKRGMVVTIEPGVYLPGRFGIRIEDMVLVTSTGCEVLTPTTKALIEL